MAQSPLEAFFYGSLRKMDDEYLIRTIQASMPEVSYVEITHQYDTPLGDDKVELTSYVDEEVPAYGDDRWDLDNVLFRDGKPKMETVTMQVSRDTYLSTICYEIAEILANECS